MRSDLPPPRRVLVVSMRFLGDALLSTPLASAARHAWPGCEIDMLVFRGCEAMLEGNPHIDRVLIVEQRPSRSEQWRHLRKHWNRYDLAFITQTGTRPFLYGWTAARFAVAPSSAEHGKNWWKQALLWKHVPSSNATARVLENEGLLKAVGIEMASAAPTPPSAGLDRTALSALIGADLTLPYVVLHPSPRWRYKQWNDDGWRALVRCLLDRACTVVVTGGPGDEERRYLERVLGDLRSPRLVPLPGRLSLAQTADLIRHARLFVGVDTATTHVAAATGTPTVAIFGPTDPVIWGPWPREGGRRYERSGSVQVRGTVRLIQNPAHGCQPCQQEGCERHVNSHSACLDDLPADRVIAEAIGLLEQRATPVQG
jgi:heptosyltransferase-3